MEKLKVVAAGRWLTLVCASLGMLLALPRHASAQSTLTWARVELVRNQVQLFTDGRSRNAQVSDVLGINDALSTARRARAELRFNDGSLARIGESAIFRFTPNTRNFRLSNGTVLLLIPPGQGRTTIQTPNAVTGVRGSALFVRFVPETNTTIIGALTTNAGGPMMAYNEDGSVQQPLLGGEIAVVRGDGTIEHLEFDLKEFYLTSELVSGLDLHKQDAVIQDEHINAVRQETLEALEQQGEFGDTDDVEENPIFLSSRSAGAIALNIQMPDFESSPAADFLRQPSLIGEFPGMIDNAVNQPDPSLGQQPAQRPEQRPAGTPRPTASTTQPTPEVPVKPEPPAPTAGPAPVPDPGQGENVPELPGQGENIPEPAPVPEPTPEPAPEVVTAPEPTPTTPPSNEIVPEIEKPAPPEPPAIHQETTSLPIEAVLPPEEDGFRALDNLEIIESVTEPETEAQLDRLPDAIVQSADAVNVDGTVQTGTNPPPGQVG
ncbi:MAG: FecR family protein, partial [Cyanobacteria bacterium P01_D01_bin.56]